MKKLVLLYISETFFLPCSGGQIYVSYGFISLGLWCPELIPRAFELPLLCSCAFCWLGVSLAMATAPLKLQHLHCFRWCFKATESSRAHSPFEEIMVKHGRLGAKREDAFNRKRPSCWNFCKCLWYITWTNVVNAGFGLWSVLHRPCIHSLGGCESFGALLALPRGALLSQQIADAKDANAAGCDRLPWENVPKV